MSKNAKTEIMCNTEPTVLRNEKTGLSVQVTFSELGDQAKVRAMDFIPTLCDMREERDGSRYYWIGVLSYDA